VVKVIGGGAEFDVDRGGKKLLRIKITAEIDGVKRDYTITYGRYGTNAALGFAVARADAPGGRKTDAEKFAAVRGAEDTPEERGRYRARMRQGASRRLQTLHRTRRRRREAAGGDKPTSPGLSNSAH